MLPATEFPAVSALALGDSARFAVICAELVLRLFNAFDAISEERLKELEKGRLAVRARVLSSYPNVWRSFSRRSGA